MPRFNLYDPPVTSEPVEEDCALIDSGESTPQYDDIPPISEADIGKLNYRQGIQLLRRLSCKTDQMKTVNDIKNYLRLRYFSQKEDHSNFFTDIEHQITDARKRQAGLFMLADLLEQELVERKDQGTIQITKDIESTDIHKGWKTTLASLKKKLCVKETAILIAGETGAGKSSLINLLIGEAHLPSAEHPCTAAICTIRNSDRKFVRIHTRQTNETDVDTTKEFALDDEEEWKKFVCDRQRIDCCRRVEFFCPIPQLKENAYFVDSPGFREGPTLTNVLTEFLPEAAAFIVMLMTDNCGGFNTSVEAFIRDIYKVIEKGSLTSEDGSNALAVRMNVQNVIFVFNRWDKVVDEMESEDVEKLRRICLNRLRQLWPIVVDGENVFFLSVSKINAMMSQKASGPIEFMKFQTALLNMVPHSIESLVNTAYTWMLTISLKFLDLTRQRLNDARKSTSEKDEETARLKRLMIQLQDTFGTRSEKLRKNIDQRQKELKKELLKHLRSSSAKVRMSDFGKYLDSYGTQKDPVVLKAESVQQIQVQLNLFTQDRISREIAYWNQENAFVENPSTGYPELRSDRTRFAKFIADIKTICYEAFSDFESQVKVLDDVLAMDNLLGITGGTEDSPKQDDFLSNLEKVFFSVTAIIWVPLLLVGGTISLPFATGFMINENISSKKKLEHYNSMREKCAVKYLDNFLKRQLTEEVLDMFLFDPLLSRTEAIRNRIGNYMNTVTQTVYQRIETLNSAWRSVQDTRKLYNPVFDSGKEVLNHIYYFYAIEKKTYEFRSEKFDDIENQSITLGTFGNVDTKSSHKLSQDVTVKVLLEAISEKNAFDVFNKEKAWSKLCRSHHKNIVQLYGLFLDRSTLRVGFVMEKCDATLAEFIDASPEYVPNKQETDEQIVCALRRMLSLVHQITTVLYFVHANKYVHRDLQMESVLIKFYDEDVIIKLYDFGWSKAQNEITLTLPGEVSVYKSPEALECEGTSTATDIYSLGILLWEMYHSEKITSYLKFEDVVDRQRREASLIAFRRDVAHPMQRGFEDLIQQCTRFSMTARPRVESVHRCVETLLKDY